MEKMYKSRAEYDEAQIVGAPTIILVMAMFVSFMVLVITSDHNRREVQPTLQCLIEGVSQND